MENLLRKGGFAVTQFMEGNLFRKGSLSVRIAGDKATFMENDEVKEADVPVEGSDDKVLAFIGQSESAAKEDLASMQKTDEEMRSSSTSEAGQSLANVTNESGSLNMDPVTAAADANKTAAANEAAASATTTGGAAKTGAAKTGAKTGAKTASGSRKRS